VAWAPRPPPPHPPPPNPQTPNPQSPIPNLKDFNYNIYIFLNNSAKIKFKFLFQI